METRDFTFGESIWFAMSSLTPQGAGKCPKSLSSGMLIAGYWLWIIVVICAFTANLAADLTIERMQKTVRGII